MAKKPQSGRKSPNSRQPASPDKHVAFQKDLVEGPSGSTHVENLGDYSDDEYENSAYEIDGTDIDTEQPQHQLQGDLDKAALPSAHQSYWDGFPPRGKAPFKTLACEKKDSRVCQGMIYLVEEIDEFAKHNVTRVVDPILYHDLLVEKNKELIRYIGCIATGGAEGKAGWIKLLTDPICQQALVKGILGRALEEQVFQKLFFGGKQEFIESLETLEQEHVDDEGFSRTQDRAKAINATRPDKDVSYHLETAVSKLTAELLTLLGPLLHEHGKHIQQNSLYLIVHHAGLLSRMMRTAGDVIYYWPPTYKDEEYEPGRMEAVNLKTMIEQSPYDRQKVNGHDRAILKDGHEHEREAIVRVVCFPGLVAYRQGGGDLARKELAAERHGIPVPEDVQAQRRRGGEQPLTPDDGIRSRVIIKSLVLLNWGRQRLLTKEAGTSAHIDAVRDDKMGKYERDYEGFKELYPLAEEEWKGVRR